jgi:hypothetical protein
MHVARAKRASFQIAELVEDEDRMEASAAEMAVPDAALLIAVRRADAGIHIEHDAFVRAAFRDAVDPMTREIGERCEGFRPCQPAGFEPPHLARRRARPFRCFAADNPAHGRVVP